MADRTNPKIIGEKALGWLLAVLADPKLSAPAKVTATILAAHMRATGDDAGLTYPSHATIGAMTGAPLRSVGFHIAAIQDRGFLWVADQGKKKATKYRCILPGDRQLVADHGRMSDRQSIADHEAEVIGNKQPITLGAVIGNKMQSDRQYAARKSPPVRNVKHLTKHAKSASDRQLVADPNRDRTESGPRAAAKIGAVPPIAAAATSAPSDTDSGRAPSASRGTPDDAFPQDEASDESEDFDTLALRAVCDAAAPDEPDDFRQAAILSDVDIEAMAAGSFEGEAWRAPHGAVPHHRAA